MKRMTVVAAAALAVGLLTHGADMGLVTSDRLLWVPSVGVQGNPANFPAEAKELESHIKEFLSVRIEDGGKEGLRFVFAGSPEINRYRDSGGAPCVWSRATCKKHIPVDAAKKYLLSFHDVGTIPDCKGRNRPFFTVRFFGLDGKVTDSKFFEFYPQPGGTDYRAEIYPPEGTKELGISFDVCGCAELTIDRLSLVAVDRETGFDILLHPMCCFDNVFHLSEGQVGGLSFAPLNKSGTKPSAPLLRVTLPKGFDIVGFRRGWVTREISAEAKDGSRTWEIQMMGFKNWHGAPHPNLRAYMLVKAQHLASDRIYQASYQAFDGDYATVRRTFGLQVDPPVKGRRPKKFMSSVQICESGYAAGPFKELAAVYEAAGFNWIYIHPWEKWQSEEIAKRGLYRFGAGCGGNGYWLWEEKDDKRPDYTRFIGLDGKVLHPYMACPASVYNRTAYYREEFAPKRAKWLCEENKFDYFISNWEPMGMLDTGGCYCENCKKDFIAFSGLPKEKVDAVWPRRVVELYRQTYFKFKSWQHGRYVATLEEDMRKAGASVGKESGLCVEITSGHMIDDEDVISGRDNAFDVKWYADKVKWIDPWGPYIFTSCENPRRVPPGDHVRLLRRAREVTRYLDRILSDRTKHPNLLGFPNGYIRDTGWTPPEELTLDILTYYAGGWQGSQTYYFLGYDNRYWRAHAIANDVIAATEDVVMDGEHLPVGSVEVETVSPYPPSVYQTPILDTETYRRGDELVVAVANFWQYGEAFYSLKVPLADRTKRYSVMDESTGRTYAKSAAVLFSGDDLAKGIMLETPRISWSFFRIVPATAVPTDVILPTAVEARLEARRGELQKALDSDLAYLKATQAPEERPADCSKLEKVENAGLVAQVVKVGEKDFVEVLGGGNRWLVDPNCGAKVSGWDFGGKELAYPDNPRFGLAEDGLWVPGTRMKRAMALMSVDQVPEGIALTFVRELNANDGNSIKGVRHTKRMVFMPKGLKVTTELHNLSGDEVRFAFRWFNTPGLLRAGEGQPAGRAILEGTDGAIEFRRNFITRYYRMRGVAEDKEIRHNFMTRDDGMVKAEVRSPSARFLSSDGKIAMTMRFSPENTAHGLAIFDASRLEVPTFEPIYNLTVLPTGQRFTATIEYAVSAK